MSRWSRELLHSWLSLSRLPSSGSDFCAESSKHSESRYNGDDRGFFTVIAARSNSAPDAPRASDRGSVFVITGLLQVSAAARRPPVPPSRGPFQRLAGLN